jgi:hypothetical protein
VPHPEDLEECITGYMFKPEYKTYV